MLLRNPSCLTSCYTKINYSLHLQFTGEQSVNHQLFCKLSTYFKINFVHHRVGNPLADSTLPQYAFATQLYRVDVATL
ncbi:hypothetical protein CW749_04710 [Vibrio sp. vnigr-6D03]|nr:hypothetical protein CW749_04710 [Vibrio sp. vnigr-6D03]